MNRLPGKPKTGKSFLEIRGKPFGARSGGTHFVSPISAGQFLYSHTTKLSTV